MEGEWFCYRGGLFNGQSWYGGGQFREDVHVMVVASLNRENSYVTEAACLMEGEWPLSKWQVLRRENGQVIEVVSLIEGKWLCYRGG